MSQDSESSEKSILLRIIESHTFNKWLTRISITVIILILVFFLAYERRDLSSSQRMKLEQGLENQKHVPKSR